jgi:hypothetical protein
MKTLVLNLKGQYFSEIATGAKKFEYRLCTSYWRKRLDNREFDSVSIRLGYPKASESSKILVRPWRGMELQTITHEFFGPDPVTVFAIRVN